MSGTLKILCTIVDVHERKTKEAQIIEFSRQLELANKTLTMQAITDDLAGLKNRRSFVDTLELGIYSASRSGRPFSLVILDIDGFKNYNDSFGHPAGDELLKDFANLISQETRLTDSVSRIGGEEFALTFPDSDKFSSVMVAERYRKKINDHKWINKNITASLGLATLIEIEVKNLKVKQMAEKMMKEADKALYEAKNRGKNQVVHFEDILQR
jgi:diguanylate cyclase (GGDEF)-like protein